MQKNIPVEKKKVLWDGVEIPGLVSVDEIKFENKTVDVTDFNEEHTINANITKIPPLVLKYYCATGTNTLDFFDNFQLNNEIKQGVIIRTDAFGNEIKRLMLKDCECSSRTVPKYDSAAPEAASITVTINAWKIIPVSAQ